MAKSGFTINNLTSILSQVSKREGWVLCVGAGTSKPAFPDWKTLVSRLMLRDGTPPRKAEELAASLLDEFSADALIAAAFEKMGLSQEDLSDALYQDFRSGVPQEKWKRLARILGYPVPGGWKEERWSEFEAFVEGNWPDMSCIQIARIVASLVGTKEAPQSIISFNAEPLLYTLLNSYSRNSDKNKRNHFDILLRSTSSLFTDRIPYLFIHGLLPIPELTKQQNRYVSTDKLVFSETEYLNLSNVSYSWQASQFVSKASTHRLVFIGVSLSDPNMRKWLSWIHATRMNEIGIFSSETTDSTIHYWIRTKPSSIEQARWIESSVAHLGIRLIWLSEWKEVGQALKIMLEKS